MWIKRSGAFSNWNAHLRAGRAALLLSLLLLGGLAVGCKKSTPAPPLLPPAAPETVARVRWLGKQRLAADTNAASLMSIWNLAESRNLERIMLDRLAVGLLTTNNVLAISNELSAAFLQSLVTNKPAPGTNYYQARVTGLPALLRPLLEDLLDQESFLEVRQVTNQPGDLAFAIHLNAQRAGLWETNLAAVLESATGNRVSAAEGRTNGWQLQLDHATRNTNDGPHQIELSRAGEWTLIGFGQRTNALAAELLGLVERTGLPFARTPKEFWLYVEGDLGRAAKALSLGWELPSDLPRVILALTGDGESVRTRAQLDFPRPLPPDLPQWNIPTNLVHDPLVSFTAIRGIGPWLSSQKLWQDILPGAQPNQLYFWAEQGLPFLDFFAARLPNASNQVSQLAVRLLERGNPWVAANSQGSFVRSTNGNGAMWKDLPLVEPFLESVPGSGGDLVYGGVIHDISSNRPPAGLFVQITSPTNLVAYDWEMTGARVVQWLYFGQFFRLFLDRGQLPDKSASVAWINALEYRLGNCGTMVTRTGPAQLSVVRRSTMGLNSVEIHLLADWLESPKFPRGLNTIYGTPAPLPGHKRPNQPAKQGKPGSPAKDAKGR
jgi:hypothetical protein